MKKTNWILENKKENIYAKKNFKYDEILENILEQRNLTTNNEFDFNPFDLKDVDIAVERIFKAIEKKEKIYIYGDYDVDGITSVSLLFLALSEIGANVDYYIPLRDEGYGLNKDAIFFLKENSADLVISVDCGINSIAEIDYANSLNVDFIITDHHEITGDIPKAHAVINPKREENIYSFKYLAGVGTAFMLAYALFSKKNKVRDLNKYLDIVAIGTVADIVPLIDDNRKFVQRGLKELNKTKWIGIKQLLRKIFPDDYEDRKYTSYDIGYIIAPIFNAAGRLEDAKGAVKLFLEEDAFQSLAIIEELLKNNSDRKALQKKIFETSIEKTEKKKLYERNLILVASNKFHHGVIGIVASKILDRYYKPTIIMEIKEKEKIATASCRSVEGLNIVECLNSVSDILIKYGGHSGAAGFTIAVDKIDEFYERVDKFIGDNFSKETFRKNIKITEILEPYKINYDFLKKMEILEPFGAKNHSPIFAFKNCSYSNLRFTRNSTEHIIFDVIKDGYYFKNCIFFNGGDYYNLIANSSNIDIAFKLKLETFMDRYMCKIQLEDVKNSAENLDFKTAFNKNGKDIIFPLETVAYTRRSDVDNPVSLKFNDYDVNLIKDRTVISKLESNLSHLLMLLKKNFNYKFKVNLEKKYTKKENINLFLKIDIDKDFDSYALKDNQLFMDIKKYLIGDFSYNSIQKNVLASIFKKQEKTLAIISKNRGISTIIDTIKFFNEQKKLKVSYNNFEEKADFYIFDNYDFKNLKEFEKELKKLDTNKILVIYSEDISLNNFSKIEDKFSIPKNIEFIEKDFIFNELPNNFYHYYLKDGEKKKIIEKVLNGEKIISTADILIHF
ncbi:MAG: single-stranded-DNA-specific exonuclease RecJ [Fusobacteriales bacterium]|nr:MAG: single-stranded-DNA-specific exonuclease RecJ [Fusobacteriales bacterium]